MAEFMLPPPLKRKASKKNADSPRNPKEKLEYRRDEMKRRRPSFSPFVLGNLSQMRSRTRVWKKTGFRFWLAHVAPSWGFKKGRLLQQQRQFASRNQNLRATLVTESVKYRQIKAHETTKGCTSPFFVVRAQRSQQLWHCAHISQSQFASFIWDPLLVV